MNPIVESARKYLGVPFRHQGRNILGLDCAGLVVIALLDIGVQVKDVYGYSVNPHKGRLETAILENPAISEIAITDAIEGDILLIKFHTEPQHVAIKTDIGIIHSTSLIGKVVEHRMTPFFGVIVKAFRVIYG